MLHNWSDLKRFEGFRLLICIVYLRKHSPVAQSGFALRQITSEEMLICLTCFINFHNGTMSAAHIVFKNCSGVLSIEVACLISP